MEVVNAKVSAGPSLSPVAELSTFVVRGLPFAVAQSRSNFQR